MSNSEMRKDIMRSADMTAEMQKEAVAVAVKALESPGLEKGCATAIKAVFDQKYGSSWHCIVGTNFGSHVTHETKNYCYFTLGQVAVLLWKTGL